MRDGHPLPARRAPRPWQRRGRVGWWERYGGNTLDLSDDDWWTCTAVHELGHAVTALATGCTVTACALNEGAAAGAADLSSPWTDVRWHSRHARLTLLYGAAMAQRRWLTDQGWWTPSRAGAVHELAAHDRAAVKAIHPDHLELQGARDAALHQLVTHWAGLLTAAQLLAARRKVTGEEIATLLGL